MSGHRVAREVRFGPQNEEVWLFSIGKLAIFGLQIWLHLVIMQKSSYLVGVTCFCIHINAIGVVRPENRTEEGLK